MPMKGLMHKTRRLSDVLAISLFFTMLSVTAHAQRAKIMIKTLKCDEGRIIHPVHLSVTVFDAGKIPEIMRVEQDLRTTDVNSDPNGIQKAEKLYSQLQDLVAKTPALARTRSLPTSDYILEIPAVQRVVVFAFEMSEFESFTYAKQELAISPERVNQAVLNFSSEDECTKAK